MGPKGVGILTYANGKRAIARLNDLDNEDFEVIQDLTHHNELDNHTNVSIEDLIGYRFHIT